MASRKRARPENARPTGLDVDRRWLATIDGHIRWLRDDYWNGWPSWRAALYLARAKHWSEQLKQSDKIQHAADLIDDVATVPLISMHIENMIGFLTQSDPRYVCTPRRAEDIESAEVQQSLLNYTWAEQEFDDQHAAVLRDFCTIGHGVMATGFAFERELELMTPAKGETAEGSTLNYDDTFRAGHPFARRVNPFFFLKDRHAPDGTLRTARWCAEIFCRPIDDIRQDRNYESSVRTKIGQSGYDIKTLASWRQENDWLQQGWDDDEGGEDIGVLVKIYDKRYRRFRVMGLGMAEPLMDEPWPYDYLDGFPYVMRNFVTLPNEPYGVGFVYFAAHQQLLLDRISTKMATHARKHNAKYIGRNWPDDDQLARFEDDEHGTLLRGESASTIEPIAVPQLGEDLYRIHQVTENNMRRLMAEDQLAAGANLPSRTSAEEVRTRNRLFGAKLKEIVRSSEKLLRDTARQVLQHIKANPDVGQFVRVAGAKGTRFVQLTADDIRGEVDVAVSAVAAEAVDPVTKRQQYSDLLERTIRVAPVANQAAMQKAQMQQMTGQPVTASLIDIDYAQLIRAVFKTYDDPELERALPEGPPTPIVLPQPVAGAQGGAPPTPQDATQSAQQSARPQG